MPSIFISYIIGGIIGGIQKNAANLEKLDAMLEKNAAKLVVLEKYIKQPVLERKHEPKF